MVGSNVKLIDGVSTRPKIVEQKLAGKEGSRNSGFAFFSTSCFLGSNVSRKFVGSFGGWGGSKTAGQKVAGEEGSRNSG